VAVISGVIGEAPEVERDAAEKSFACQFWHWGEFLEKTHVGC